MSAATAHRPFSPLPKTDQRSSSLSSQPGRDRKALNHPAASSDRLGALKDSSQVKRSSSTPPATSSLNGIDKKKKRSSKPSEMELARRKIKLLSSYRELSPTLPPSPPPSRSPSPRPSHHLPSSASSYPSLAPPSTASSKRSIPSPPSEEEDVQPFGDSRKRSRLDDDREARDAEATRLAKEAEEREAAIAERKRKRASEVWDTDRYKRLAKVYKERARNIKHAADARTRSHPNSSSAPPTDHSVMSLVELTDSILLFVYAFWCEDQTTPGRVGVEMWRSLDGMKKVVRTLWEGVVKASGGGKEEESAKALLGLSYLIDALVLLHTTVYEQSVLHTRTQRISSSPRPPPLPHPASTSRPNGSQSSNSGSSLSAPTGGLPPADSPSSLASASSSPSSSSDPSHGHIPADYIPNILALTNNLPRSLRLLSTSQQLLSFPVLRKNFPSTWTTSMNSDIAGCGGDGGERMVDPDWVEGGWGWPLGPSGAMGVGTGGSGVGAGGMLPHLVVFGRALLKEFVQGRKETSGVWEYDLVKGWRGVTKRE